MMIPQASIPELFFRRTHTHYGGRMQPQTAAFQSGRACASYLCYDQDAQRMFDDLHIMSTSEFLARYGVATVVHLEDTENFRDGLMVSLGAALRFVGEAA